MLTVKAHVSLGTWIADCPQCGGAEIVFMGRPFECKGQTSAGFHGETTACKFTAEVEFPKEKLEIEKLLLKRPVGNRHWEITETLDTLRADNKAHGLGE